MAQTVEQILADLPISSRYIREFNIPVHVGTSLRDTESDYSDDTEDDDSDDGVSYRPGLGLDLGLLTGTPDQKDDACLHEVAHWLVSAPYRRNFLNYGLGEGFLDDNYKSRRIISNKAAQWEEERACALCIVVVHKLNPFWQLKPRFEGMPAWVQTADSVQWFDYHGYNRRTVTPEVGLKLAYMRLLRVGITVSNTGAISGIRLTTRKTFVRVPQS